MSGGRDPIRVALDLLPLSGSPTGVGTFCANLLAALLARPEVEVHGYAVSANPALVRRRLPGGVSLKSLRVPARLVNAAWRHGPFPAAEMLAGPAEVVHGTNYVVPPSKRLARVVSVYDMTAWRYPELCSPATLAYPGLLKRALASGAFVHAVTRFGADELVELAGADASRVRVVPLAGAPSPSPGVAADPPAADPSATGASGPARQRPYVLAVGTIEPRKDYPTLVSAFSQIMQEEPDLGLVIAGAEGWGSQALEETIQATGSAARVRRLGYVSRERLSSLVAGASVLAYPSLYEGFGLPPLEAMAAGVPVVASDAGPTREVLGDGAVIVPSGDVAELASGLLRVIGDSSLRAELVARGRARAAMYTWDATARAMIDLYREACNERR
ncbi:MAG: glycosyltransferase family 4 protein [Acidimicrobiales bacterium]